MPPSRIDRRAFLRTGALLGAGAASLALVGCGSDAQPAPTPTSADPAPDPVGSDSSPAPAATDPAPALVPSLENARPSDWAYPNYDALGTRATFGSHITADTVGELRQAWTYPLPPGAPFGAATNPIVLGNTVYLGELLTNVHAIDLESGQQRWRADIDQPVYGPSGVAIDGGRVFGNRAGHSIAAYDARSGERLWSTNIIGGGGFINIQPLAVDGLVLAATSSLSQPGARGTLFALDQASGEIIWSFDTIESPDLWGNPEINSGGGAWYPPAVDRESGVSYWGTSNPYPFPGAPGFPNGASRPGDNRWTDSILAIDYRTGEFLWGHQAIAHDIFDRDAILAGLAVLDDGNKVVISSGKLGRVIGLTTSGVPLWDTPVGMHMNDHLTSFEGELTVLPGAAGGVLTPLAIANATVYAAVVNAPETYAGPDQASPGNPALGTFPSQLVAVDAHDGSIVWDVELPGDCFGGATVVNDLVFTSIIDGRLIALDRASGETVWSRQVPGGINAWPAVSEDMLILPVSFADPPFLIAFSL